MKSFYVMLFVVLASFQGSAQHTISGTITNKETNEPIPGAHIYIPDLQKGTTTDEEGQFELTDLSPRRILIEIGYLGFSTQVINFTVNGPSKLDLALVPSVTEMSELVVTGNSSTTLREINPIPSMVIKDLSTTASAQTNVIDALATQPGISQITTGAAISKPLIRGLGYNRVVVLNNGIRQEGQQWGDEHGIEIDEYAVGNVEIIKGPGSILYGSDAMAGVIHFLAPRPIEKGKIAGSLLTNYQSNNNMIGISAMNAGNIKDINWLARVSSKTAGNYSNANDGSVYNSGFKELNFNGSVGVNKKWGYADVYVSNFTQELALIEGERDSLGQFVRPIVLNDSTVEETSVTQDDLTGYQIGIPRQEIGHLKIGTSSKFFFKNSALAANVAFQQNSRKEFANPLDTQEEELYFLLHTANYRIKYSLPEWKKWQTSVGVSGMFQTSSNKGAEYVIPAYELYDAGLFVLSQKTFEKVHLSGGIRYDNRTLHSYSLYLTPEGEPTEVNDTAGMQRFEDLRTSFSNVSGSIGMSYRHTHQLVSKVNVSRGFRSPNMAELTSNGIHEGAFRYEIGNQQLNPETSLQLDAGLLYTSEHVSMEIGVFSNSIQQYIYLLKLSRAQGGDSIIDLSDPAPTYQFTQGDAHLYGGEMVIDVHPHPLDWLHIENSFSFVRGNLLHQPDSMSNLPFMPAPIVRSELRGNLKEMSSLLKNVFIKVDLSYTLYQTHVLWANHTETTTPDYMLLNAGLGGDVVSKKGTTLFTISLLVSNIFDKAYQSHLSRLKYAPENTMTGRQGVFNMGRNFSIKLLVPFQISTRQ